MAPGAEEQLEALGVPLSAPERFVAGLRAHAAAVGGASIAEYRSGAVTLRQHAEKLEALRALGRPGLLVHEPPLLGAFGFELDSGLVNRDSLRFSEILIALDREDMLAELALQAAVAVEVGGGWGGLAFHLKTRFPGLRYVIIVATAFAGAWTLLLSGLPFIDRGQKITGTPEVWILYPLDPTPGIASVSGPRPMAKDHCLR